MPGFTVSAPCFYRLERICDSMIVRQDERVVKWLERHSEESESLLAAVYSLGRSFRTQLAHYVPDPVVRLSHNLQDGRGVAWVASDDMQLLYQFHSLILWAAPLLGKATKPSAGHGRWTLDSPCHLSDDTHKFARLLSAKISCHH